MSSNAGFTLIEVLVTLAILSIGALAVMKHVSQTQDMMADIGHTDTMARLAGMKLHELEEDGFSASLSRQGGFDGAPGFSWTAQSGLLESGGWYRMELVVRREDSGRSLVVERLFREGR
ncbi:type II secretion system protein [Salidesulfovibrio onnuriiensis]|uniref:type II secretion system protein n=1 Tax=Salidesulfovibrio onnuriiensis TaxID=2583823 RepID=UPI0011CA3E5B|nr:prepilin-type N-terminal cleavage/methylation domain-containing protein [Salidesulfovibrio onnuriiensis]